MRGRSFSLFLGGLLFLGAVAIAAEPSALIADSFTGSYAGETLIRSLGDTSLVVAIDETGEGAATRLFFVETARPVGALSLRSPVSRVERSPDTLVVNLPREHRSFSFSLAAESSREPENPGPVRQKGATSPRLEVTRFDGVHAIREYRGNLTRLLLPNVTLSTIGAKGLQAFTEAIDIDYQNYDDGNNGGGCVRSCNVSCGDGSSCSATCGAGQCGNCSCTFGASCSCK